MKVKPIGFFITAVAAIFMIAIVLPTRAFAYRWEMYKKTHNDVYAKAQLILEYVDHLRKHFKVDMPITMEILPQKGKKPHHVLQKSHEVTRENK